MRKEKDLYIGYVEMALGIGDMLGPAISSVFYNFSGFAGTFFAFSAIIFLGIIYCIVMIPNSLNTRFERSTITS